jgi:HSP20 family molecular chaperone IbpA
MMKINKTYQTYPFALTVGSLLNVMDSKWQREQFPNKLEETNQNQFSDFRVSEMEDSYEVKYLLPGFDKNNVTVTLEDSEIRVKASIDETKDDVSFGSKDYSRVLKIPESCEQAKIKAKLDNGILSVVLPKRKAVKPIEIKIS